MDAPTYRFRLTQFRKETTYRLTERALAWGEGPPDGALAFADIRRIRVYDSPGASGMPAFRRCTIKPKAGRAVILSSNHFAGLADWESRTARFDPFVDTLLRQAALANPRIEFISGMPAALWIGWIAILIGLCVVTPLAIAVVVIEGKEMSPGALGALAVCAAMVLAFFPLLRLVRRNRPRRFDARAGYPAE
jgi:hypothetical protein